MLVWALLSPVIFYEGYWCCRLLMLVLTDSSNLVLGAALLVGAGGYRHGLESFAVNAETLVRALLLILKLSLLMFDFIPLGHFRTVAVCADLWRIFYSSEAYGFD